VHARLALSTSDESVQLRIDYARDSLTSGTGSFLHINWFGVGIGNFTTWLTRTQPNLPAYYVQPAHNLFLLVYSEIGILGLFALVAVLVFVFRACWRAHARQPALRAQLVLLLAVFCGIALFDHFFWTLQQGRILWWGMLALTAGIL
jgi:O-antigen ligase